MDKESKKKPLYCEYCSLSCAATECDCVCHDREEVELCL